MSDKHLRAIAERLPQLMWLRNCAGEYEFLGSNWLEFVGIAETDQLDLDWTGAIHPDDRPQEKQAWSAFISGGADYDVEYRLRHRNGDYHWFRVRGTLVRNDEGLPQQAVGTATEIDKRIINDVNIRVGRPNMTVSSSEAVEEIAFDKRATDVGYWYSHAPFDVLECDELVAAHFNLQSDSQVPLKSLIDFVHVDDFERARSAIETSVKQRRGFDVYFRTAHPKPGLEKWVRGIGWAFYSKDGAPTYLEGITLDVTRQRSDEKRQEFLAKLANELQPLVEPDEISARTARRLAEYLGADRCAYAEVKDESTYVITGDYAREVPSIVGEWEIAAFGAEHLRMMRAGEAYVIHHVANDPRISQSDLPAYRATTIQAVICVPLLKEGRLTAAMAVHQSVPRDWLIEEVDLVRTVVSQCWETLERARANRLLKSREEQIRLITDAIPALIAFVDSDLRYQFVNLQYEDWFGTSKSQIVGKHVSEVVGALAYDQLSKYISRALSGEKVEFEAYAAYPSGARHIRASLVPRFDGAEVVGFFSLVNDVTARVSAQEQLRASEARFRAFMDNSPAAAWITDIDGEVQYVSKAYSRLFDTGGRQVLGAKPIDLYPAEFAEQYVRNIRLAAESRASVETIEQAPRPDGTVGDFLVYKFLLPGSELVGGVAIDITERLRAESLLLDADRRKDEFLATLAHELRNPLAPIRNGLQVLRLVPNESDEFSTAHSMMERQITHMVRLVDDLLDVSRITRNKLELRKECLQLSEVIESAVESSSAIIKQFEHELSINLPSIPIYLEGDLTRLAQVFSNLLNNSAKYTNPGGSISLSAGLLDSQVEVVVRDNGIGIPASAIGSLFQMFSQVESNSSRSHGGLGIGLALVRKLVEMHGGSISVASDGPGKGSAFTVRLPLLEVRQPSERISNSNRVIPAGANHRVLIVDDNRDAALTLELMLRAMGYKTCTAHDGLAAVSTAEAFKPELIFLDIGMPNLNGYDACRLIRQNSWSQGMFIVALSGWGQEEDKQKSLKAGFDMHFVKPLELSALEQLLTQCFSRGV